MREEYRNRVRLLLQILPFLSEVDSFALKGGTAINFFIRDFPRLSVDIDLTYLPVKERNESLREISHGVQHISDEIENRIPGTKTIPLKSGVILNKLLVNVNDAQVKLEVNTVLRGAIYGSADLELSPKLQKEFELFAAVKTLSFEDLYGGKLCAALDRQHPRDLFDIHLLLENEGITENVKKAFIGYLVNHSRPMNELLNPNIISIDELYHKEFEGMTREEGILEDLIDVQQKLPGLIVSDLTDDEKEFLISFKKGSPKWELLPIPILKDLPGVQWKLMNILQMDKQKHKQAIEKLENVLV
jgi:predicted nucleotidyltransferase component of viral defense system